MKQIILVALMGMGFFNAGAQRRENSGQWQQRDGRYDNRVTVINNSAGCGNERYGDRDRGRRMTWNRRHNRGYGNQQGGYGYQQSGYGNQQGVYGQHQSGGTYGNGQGNGWNGQNGGQSSGGGRTRGGRGR